MILLMFTALSADTQMALDKDNTIFTLEKKLAAKTSLLDQYPDFKEARLFQTEHDYILEITHKINGQLSRTVKKTYRV